MVVGSGIQATELSRDVGVQLLANPLATVFGLGVLIALLGPASGAHFNPVVPLAAWFTGRRSGDGPTARDVATYVPARIAGAIAGAVLADGMFGKPLVQWSTHDRFAGHLWLGEVVATAGLILLIFGLARTDRAHLSAVAVASYIGAAYWFSPPPRSRTLRSPSAVPSPTRSPASPPSRSALSSRPSWSVPRSGWGWCSRCSGARHPHASAPHCFQANPNPPPRRSPDQPAPERDTHHEQAC
ncbi:hypothetical protein GCM10018966_090430 [Streptomyces yanii]